MFASCPCPLSLLISKLAHSDPIVSCSQTPYPEICTSRISTSTSLSEAKTPSNFRNLVLRATLDQALQTHEHVSSMDLSSLDKQAKVAWADCFELCKLTISQLNRSMMASVSHDDEQTWLSAAIANQQTCLNGFLELESSVHLPILPFLNNNISKSVSNSLAISKSMTRAEFGGGRRLLSDGFPMWVSAADRKLLQTSTIKANLVVAKDGSGDYKTIEEALAASVNLRTSTSRFVIHVKAGVYNEYVGITSSMNNLMIIGDGKDVTVITGSHSVQDGYTTFQSATFCE